MRVLPSSGVVLHSLASGVFLLTAIFAPPANAAIVYTYAGDYFTNYTAPYDALNSIYGSFSVATPLDLPTITTISPTTYSFSDGIDTYNDSNSRIDAFQIETDPNGDIVNWTIYLLPGDLSSIYPELDTIDNYPAAGPTYNFDQVIISLSPANISSEYNSPGTWTIETVPEPTSTVLVAWGLLGLVWTARKLKHQRK